MRIWHISIILVCVAFNQHDCGQENGSFRENGAKRGYYREMYYYLLFILLLLPVTLWALPCPNGNGILYKGDSIDEVISQCGEPTTKRTSTRTLYTSQFWTYYISHQYNTGFSQMTIAFKNNLVSNIHIDDHFGLSICNRTVLQYGAVMTVQTSCDGSYDVASTLLCGYSFGLGESTDRVAYICGPPAAQTPLQSYTIEVTELVYTGDSEQTIVFENGKLTDWKPL